MDARGPSSIAVLALVFVLAFAAAPAGAAAIALPAGLEPGGQAVVREVIDGDTLALADGRELRLIGVQAPKPPLGRTGAWPLADEAKAALEQLALGRTVALHYGGTRGDRHGRVLAHVVDGEGAWLQGAMLARGMARVYTFPDNRAAAAEMLAIEREARIARRGIWRHLHYRILDPEQAGRFIDTFQIVEGRVLQVATVKGASYLNFGADWRRDFTVRIAGAAWGPPRLAKHEIAAFEGAQVRVRGWLRSYNGAMIDATHPEQIEILGR